MIESLVSVKLGFIYKFPPSHCSFVCPNLFLLIRQTECGECMICHGKRDFVYNGLFLLGILFQRNSLLSKAALPDNKFFNDVYCFFFVGLPIHSPICLPISLSVRLSLFDRLSVFLSVGLTRVDNVCKYIGQPYSQARLKYNVLSILFR